MASSADEGEISDNSGGHGDLKASSLSYTEGSGVDPRDRTRNRHSSPEHDSASRYGGNNNSARRSRSPRGYKRSRDDRDYHGDRRDQDSRHYRASYQNPTNENYRRSRTSYEDLDRPVSRGSELSYDGRPSDRDRDRDRDNHRRRDRSRDRDRYSRDNHERYPDKRPRNRSRSPYGSRRDDRNNGRQFVREGHYDRRGGPSQGANSKDHVSSKQTQSSVSHHTTNGAPKSQSRKDDSRPNQDHSRVGSSNIVELGESQATKDAEPEPEWEEPQQIDEDAEIERRRKRREEILAKSHSATPLLLHAVGATDKTRASSPASSLPNTPIRYQSDVETPRTPLSNVASPRSPASQDVQSPGGVNLLDENSLRNSHGGGQSLDDDGPSAADYDPTVDMKEDERRDELRHGQVVLHGEPHTVEGVSNQTQKQQPLPAPEPEAKKKPATDGDDDDDFDMFAEDFDEEKYATIPVQTIAPIEAGDALPEAQGANKGGILEGDDKDGYYKIRIGEVLNGRYQIQATLGRGMFSGVARALDITTKKLVAIKLMRNNDALRKGGFTEIAILQKLNEADPENRKHIVKFERSFDYKGHLCMVFEHLSMNLREVLRKFGNNVGINLGATRTYAYQIFVALAHMRKCSIVHADLKPDNILVNETRNVLKICDLGTAIDRSDAATAHTEITPYLVSRFYRAPEIILGMPYDYGVDMWSIGCTLYELYTGKILFTGDSNNQMLKAIMEVRGKITPKVYKRGQLAAMHFDDQAQFVSVERDKVLGKTAVRTLPMVKPTRDLRTRLMAASTNMNDSETRELHQFIDLLEHCLALNPDKRMKPADALKHPFFTMRAGVPRR
ncbi:Serine/threonine-protein kinase prp4 [Paramyrothecium foliicola]|nr:Serine/threonine-protein kinase prp4 [Paramyrothecium foliicola]